MPAAAPTAQAIAPDEWRAALQRPGSLLTLVLEQRGRLAATVSDGRGLGWALLALLLCSVVSALPYGFVLSPARAWRIAALFVGSLAICYPSLQMFSSYLGSRVPAGSNLLLALCVTAVAGLFTFGFFPIVWFLDATMRQGDLVTAADASVALLAVSLGAGLWQLLRCQQLAAVLTADRGCWLVRAWMALLVYVTWRMARALELLA